MEYNLNNPLWETDPKKAKKGLRKELEDRAKTADDGTISGYNFKKLIKEILEG